MQVIFSGYQSLIEFPDIYTQYIAVGKGRS